jgi:two-component system, sporulation sensor kinase E
MINVLLVLEYKYPLLITGYHTDIAKYIEMSIGVTTTVVANALFYVIILNYYHKEQEMVSNCLAQIEQQKRDIEFQNHLKQMDKEVARLDRFNLIGQMAASIGHEVRNPMTTIRGFLQYFGMKSEFSMYGEEFNIMINEIDRANEIITEFLSLAKTNAVSLTQSSLNDFIKAIYPLLKATALEKGHNMELELDDVDDLLLDEKEIRQIILNLVYNAFEAIVGHGIVRIKTYQEGDSVVLVIQDNGCGIAQEVLKQLGTPFVTTKETGTGLGLSVCYRIVERHNAKLEVETSALGTTFFIIFNIPQSEPA